MYPSDVIPMFDLIVTQIFKETFFPNSKKGKYQYSLTFIIDGNNNHMAIDNNSSAFG